MRSISRVGMSGNFPTLAAGATFPPHKGEGE